MLGLPLWGLLDNPYSDPQCFDNGEVTDYSGIHCAAGDSWWMDGDDEKAGEIREKTRLQLQNLQPKASCLRYSVSLDLTLSLVIGPE